MALHLLTHTHHHRLTLLATHHHSPGLAPLDPAAVAVVDGAALLLTPFTHSTVPPPLAAHTATFPGPVNGLAFCLAAAPGPDADDSGFLDSGQAEADAPEYGAVCVQHGPDTLTLLGPAGPDPAPAGHGCKVEVGAIGGPGSRPCMQPPAVRGQYRVTWPAGAGPRPARLSELYHWVWPSQDTLLATFTTDTCCCLAVIQLQGEEGQAVASQVLPLEDWVVAVAGRPGLAVLLLASGAVLQYEVAATALLPFTLDGAELQLPAPCQHLALCPLDDGTATLPLCLTPRGRLHLGRRQLLAGCTSVLVHGHHLLATTTAHTLLALPLTTQGLANLEQAGAGPGVRRVERGARLVVGAGQDTRVVLQMPRGNLEVVSPRPLAIQALARLLATRQYGAAMELARRHRIDTNLLHDHDPPAFLAMAQHFVRDVADPQRLDVFLASLAPADTAATTYSFHYPGRPASAAPGKVEAVCRALREAMVAVDEGRYLLPILTSLVRAGHLEEALAWVGRLRQPGEAGPGRAAGPEEGLRHLLCLADQEDLYRVALGTYDLGLALMVAQHSARDPKEYLPHLQQLQQLPPPLRRFRIDVWLRRYPAALAGLQDGAPHAGEAMELVQAMALYPLALRLLPPASQLKVDACRLYGQHLLAQDRPGEAAIMLGRSGQHREAMEAYSTAGDWQMALVMAAKLGLAREQVAELCRGLAGRLRERGRPLEAARLYEEQLAMEEEAVECLAGAGAWPDALRLAHRHGRQDLVEANILPAALQQAATARADIQETAETLASQAARLSEVRRTKEQQQQQAAAGPDLAGEDGQLDTDLYSEASSVSGLGRAASSGRSQRSSKSRRKLERKKYSTRPGGPHEDLGLVAALHQAMAGLASRAEAVGGLCRVLATLDRDTEAATLQQDFSDLLAAAGARKAEVWPPLPAPGQDGQEFGPDVTTEAALQRVRGGAGQAGAGASFLAQRMALLDPHLRYPPPPPPDTWRLNLLT